MPIKINGSTSGSTTITAPATGSDETIELSTALAAKAPLASPALTGTPTVGGTAITAIPGLQIVTPTSVAGTGVTVSGGKVSFTSATAVSVNGCFSATWTNYFMLLTLTSIPSADLNLRFRQSGTDNANSYYLSSTQWHNGTAWTLSRDTSLQTTLKLVGNAAIGFTEAYMAMDIYNPYVNAGTGLTHRVGMGISVQGSGTFTAAAQFDGLTIYPASSNISGSLVIYGYRAS